MAALESEALGNVANMSCDKVSVSKLTVKNYISTENMLPDRGGIGIAAKLPTAGNVNIFSPGDVLFSNIRTYFKKVWLADRHGGASADVIIFRPRDTKKVDSQYLYYVLSSDSFIKSTVTASKGTKMPRGDKDAMLRYTMPLPSFNAQRRIAGILSAYDELIENNQRRIRILEDMARSLYREWFVHFRYPGHESISLVDSPFGKMPQGWELVDMEKICTDNKGIQTGPFGSQLHESDYSDEGVPVVMPKDIIGFRIRTDSIARIPEETADKLGRHRMQPGDIVYGRRGDIGRRAYLMPFQAGWFCGTGCLRIRPNPKAVSGWYLFNYLGQDDVLGLIAGRAQGVTMPNLNTGVMSSVPVKLPPRKLQEEFERLTFPMAEAYEALIAKNGNLRRTRDLLLPRLLSGQVELADLPAEVLP